MMKLDSLYKDLKAVVRKVSNMLTVLLRSPLKSRPNGAVVRESRLLYLRFRVRIPGKAWMSSCPSLAPPVAALTNW